MEFGELVLILIKKKNDTSFSGVSVRRTDSKRDSKKMKCLKISALIDFCPLPSYIEEGYQMVPLKHSVVSC